VKTVSAAALLFLFTALSETAAALVATKVEMRNGADTVFRDSGAAPLGAGALDVDGDGHVVQFGYYNQATVTNPFSGTWVPLSGAGATNTWRTTIGDNVVNGPAADGRFNISIFFQPGTPNGFDFPPSTNIPMAIRFYDDFSIQAARRFNAVANTTGAWNWKDDGRIDIVIENPNDAALAWEGGPGSAYRTTIPIGVPEPSALALLLAGGCAITARVRKAALNAPIGTGTARRFT